MRAYTADVTRARRRSRSSPSRRIRCCPTGATSHTCSRTRSIDTSRVPGPAPRNRHSWTPVRGSRPGRVHGRSCWSRMPRPRRIAAADELWAEMASTRPLIFAVHIGADSHPIQATHFMQDWADTSNGFYQYARSHAEVDRAFDRMATWLRRPATYGLGFRTSEELLPPPDPGTLSVATEGGPGTPAPVGSGVAVEIVLDTSGSMLDRFGGERRIDIAKRLLAAAIRNDLPAGVPVALRVFTQRKDSCQSELAVPLGPLDKERLATLIEGLKVDRSVNTPLADCAQGGRFGSCGRGWPQDRHPRQRRPGELRRRSGEGGPATQVAGPGDHPQRHRTGPGRQEDPPVDPAPGGTGRRQLLRRPERPASSIGALAGAVSAPFEVRDEAGAVVGDGTVNGGSIELPPGTYQVVVRRRSVGDLRCGRDRDQGFRDADPAGHRRARLRHPHHRPGHRRRASATPEASPEPAP